MTYMWKEERGKPYYRFQSDEKEIHQKMKRRQKFKLVGEGINCNLWIYQTIITRSDIAKKILKTLSGGEVNFDSKADVFVCESPTSNA